MLVSQVFLFPVLNGTTKPTRLKFAGLKTELHVPEPSSLGVPYGKRLAVCAMQNLEASKSTPEWTP
jgi:hypothetical protein